MIVIVIVFLVATVYIMYIITCKPLTKGNKMKSICFNTVTLSYNAPSNCMIINNY